MRILIIILFVLLFQFESISQVKETNNDTTFYKNSVSWSPALTFFKGLKMSYAKRLSELHEIQISPFFYYHITEADYKNSGVYYDAFVNSYDEMRGGGLEFTYKNYIYKTDDGSDIYASAGLELDYFNFKYKQYEWGTEIIDGLEYYKFGLHDINENIYAGNLKFLAGIKGKIIKSLFYDISFGIGARYSFKYASLGKPRKFNTLYFGKGYTGTMPILGIKIGKNF